MSNMPPLALRSGQTGWETLMLAEALVDWLIDGKPPEVPLLVTDDDWQQVQRAVEGMPDHPTTLDGG